MKTKVILLVYGDGGHREQMKRFYSKIDSLDYNYQFISVSEEHRPLNSSIDNYSMPTLRNKYSYLKSFLDIPLFIKEYVTTLININKKYEVMGIISTGPGIVIPISLYYKINGKKIVFLETWSRFETQSFTGKFMYKIADKFYIQNLSLKKIYPNGIYGGLL